MTDEEKKTEKVTDLPDLIDGCDLKESYMYCQNYVTSNPVKAYRFKKKGIKFGMELLPSFIDPVEKNAEQIKKNEEKQGKIEDLYNRACEILKTEIPKKRKVAYDQQGTTKKTVYSISSGDADTCECLDKDFKDMLNDFTNQQHEQHMEGLEGIDNEILHVLTQRDIIEKIKPTIKDILDKRIKKVYENLEV